VIESGAFAPGWTVRLADSLHRLDDTPDLALGDHRDICDLLTPGVPPRPAAVLVPIRMSQSEPTVIFTRRSEQLAQHSGQVSFPGGRIEAFDASPAAAALRESREEIGMPDRMVTPLGYLNPLLTVTGFRVQPVVGLIEAGFEPRLDPSEVAEAFEVPLGFLLDRANARRVQAQYRGRLRTWHEFHYQDRLIWGVTAEIILDLRSFLEGE
jgi:8-oxo-dGTP pyrophosphatase MutT (NUDIX family)